MIRFILFALMVGVFGAAHAQEPPPTNQPADCPTIVRSAITLTNERCQNTDLNQICYGHLVLDVQPRTGLVDFGFKQPGDIVNVVEVQSLRLSALDTATGRWGVVMMQIEANLAQGAVAAPEVQILLFGDAELNDATHFLPGEIMQPANVREQPAETSAVLTSLHTGDSITANGRLADGSWVRLNLAGTNGWVRSDLIRLRGDLESLAIITAEPSPSQDELAQFGPMQAFYFRSGVDDAPCAQAPNSGLLIQTPEGVASISIWMDEVVIQVDATAFIQAQPDGNLIINVLDGQARVSARGDTRTVVSGMQVGVPLDENLAAAGVPGDPAPYDASTVAELPVDLLNRPVEIASPRNQPVGIPIPGTWGFAWDAAALTCPDGTVVPFESTGASSAITVTGETLRWNAARYTQTTTGVYHSSYADDLGNLHQDTLQVIAPDRIVGEKVLDLASRACTLNVGFQLQLINAAGETPVAVE
ncbi:MAG: SH3 domain-containing protein [Anaerolineae bacterium]|nr:SH3 domain-containing protein [Anaerolineae bacterium]